jgi:hypothetical protein
LPPGLSFNSSTGEISGRPTELAARQTYQVTGDFDFGEITRAISFAVGQLFTVEAGCSSSNCTGFDEALSRANTLAPMPSVIAFQASESLRLASEYTILGDLEIRGGGSVFDARQQSRHFLVKTGASLSLQDLTLQNGQAPFGGAIAVESGNLNVSRVKFENNAATNTNGGQGGAISFRGKRLNVVDSQFNKNITPQSGGDLQGGAIYSYFAEAVSIARSTFNNSISARGGAIYLDNRNGNIAELSDLSILNSKAITGGGLYFTGGDAIIRSSKFESNSSIFRGGAIEIEITDRVWIENSQFRKNASQEGSAISYNSVFHDWPRFYIIDSVFEGNILDNYSLTYFSEWSHGSALRFTGPVKIKNSTFENSSKFMSNCDHWTIPSPEAIISLGGNIFDDESCK